MDSGYVSREGGVQQCECRTERIRQRKLGELPLRFRFATFEGYSPKSEIQSGTKSMISGAPDGSYFIYGAYGNGKTHLLAAQFRAVVDSGFPCQFWTTAELLHELQRLEFDRSYPSKLMEAVRFGERFHLFWDDCDKFKPSEFKSQALFELIDTIYGRKHRLSLTSNYSLTDLVDYEKLDPALVRRIDQSVVAVQV